MQPGYGGGSGDPFEICLVGVILAVFSLVVVGRDQFVGGQFLDAGRVGLVVLVVVVDHDDRFALEGVRKFGPGGIPVSARDLDVRSCARAVGPKFGGRDVAMALAVLLVPFVILAVVAFDEFPCAGQLRQVYGIVVLVRATDQ